MRRCRLGTCNLLFLITTASIFVRTIDGAPKGATQDENDFSRRRQMKPKLRRYSRRIRDVTNRRYHYDSFLYQSGSGSGGNARDFLIRQFANTPPPTLPPTPAPVIRDILNVKPVSPEYFYDPLVLFPKRETQPPTTEAPTTVPPTRLPTPSPTPLPTKQPTLSPTPSPTPLPTKQPTLSPTPLPTSKCGNGKVDVEEECDSSVQTFFLGDAGCLQKFDDANVGSLTCIDCQCVGCGNGRLDDGEECDRRLDDGQILPTSACTDEQYCDRNCICSAIRTPVPTPEPLSTPKPTKEPTNSNLLNFDEPMSFEAGNFSDGKRSSDERVILSNGLSARPIAEAGERVKLADGTESELKFHQLPDGAAVFPSKKDNGWLYVSNAENDKSGDDWDHGGVGVLEFNSDGQVTAYYKIASGTKRNCGGGATPWNSWITCEEVKGGLIHQTDPHGVKMQAVTAMGDLGYYESFAYDDGTTIPTFYATKDKEDGVVTRFTPDSKAMECYVKPNDYDRWCTLDSGSIDYLYLADGNKVEWIEDEKRAGENAKDMYPNSEGIDVKDGVLYFTSKKDKVLVTVNLRSNTYTSHSTKCGAFDNQPDQLDVVLGVNAEMLLLCEDGGKDAGLHGRDLRGNYFTVLYRDENVDSNRESEETTGLGVSPDFKHL